MKKVSICTFPFRLDLNDYLNALSQLCFDAVHGHTWKRLHVHHYEGNLGLR